MCVRNTVLVKQERGDPHWQDNLTHARASKLIDNDTETFDWNSCTGKFVAKVQRKSGKASTTRSVVKDLY